MNTTRLFIALALLCMGTAVLAGTPQPASGASRPTAALSRTVTFDIPAQSLASALLQFSRQSGVEFTVAAKALEGRKVAALKGTYVTDRALAMLLADTGLKFETVDDGTVAIRAEREPVNTGADSRGTDRLSEVRLARITPQAATMIEEVEPVTEAKPLEILVTGSRIRGTAENGVHPVVVYTQEDLQRYGITSIADIKRLIPQLGASNKTDGAGVSGRLQNNTGAVPGAADARATANLRGLPNNTTLILVDGQRLSRTGQSNGADNYDFGGIPLSAIDRIEVLSAGASAVYGADAIAGAINIILKKNYAGTQVGLAYDATEDGGGQIRTVSLSPGFAWGKLKGLASFSYLEQSELRATDRWFTASDDKTSIGGPPIAFALPGGRGIVSSVVPPFPPANLPGLPVPQTTIPPGADGQSATIDDYANAGPLPETLDYAQYTNLIDPREETSAMLRLQYGLSSASELYLDGRWSQRFNHDIRSGPPVIMVQIPAGYPGNPFGAPVNLTKALFDMPAGFMEKSVRLRDWGASSGVRGNLKGDWRYDLSAHWTRSRLDDHRYNLGTAGLTAAISDPDPAKRPNLLDDSTTGPSPISLQQYIGWADGFPSAEVSDNFVYAAQLDGTLLNLPSGPVRAAFRAEYTHEKARFVAQPADTSSFNAQIADNARSVRSLVGEIRLPLAPENTFPLVYRLEAGVQARHDTFSDFGDNLSPGYSLLYAPARWLTLRASVSKGFKVPALMDLKGPTLNSATFIPPAPAVIDPLTGQQLSGVFQVQFGSNPGLDPERSRSTNFGAVLSWKGLSFFVDRFDIDFKDRSTRPSPDDIFTFFPERAIRGPGDSVIGFDMSPVNFASLRAQGWDYRAIYQLPTKGGELSLQLSWSDAEPTRSQSTPNAQIIVQDMPDRGTASIFWSRGAWEMGLNAHYQSSILRSNGRIWSSELGYDPQVSYHFRPEEGFNSSSPSGWMRLLADMRVSMTVFNAIYKDVSVSEAAFNSWVLDPRLRRYAVSINKSF